MITLLFFKNKIDVRWMCIPVLHVLPLRYQTVDVAALRNTRNAPANRLTGGSHGPLTSGALSGPDNGEEATDGNKVNRMQMSPLLLAFLTVVPEAE
ncbi:hypothetical protein CDAR_9201 [Caerostris darwini]|uniref:Uncharacterized protein n=1 Tax=Caerostris darwini TaxID=1538125 RepID=A0AAV4TWC6_9ARAC|nr:hypothetical protein CDAR_9201 [Caerostris darwini]